MKTITNLLLIFSLLLTSCEDLFKDNENPDDEMYKDTFYINKDSVYYNFISLKVGDYLYYEVTGNANNEKVSGELKITTSSTDTKNPNSTKTNLFARTNFIKLSVAGNTSTSNAVSYFENRDGVIYIHGIKDTDNKTFWINEGNPIKQNFLLSENSSYSSNFSLKRFMMYSSYDGTAQWYDYDENNVTETYLVEKIEFAGCKLGLFETFKIIHTYQDNNISFEETLWTYPNFGPIKTTRTGNSNNLNVNYEYNLVESNIKLE